MSFALPFAFHNLFPKKITCRTNDIIFGYFTDGLFDKISERLFANPLFEV